MNLLLVEEEPLPPDEPADHLVVLAAAFSEFIAASGRLESSYRELQDEVTALRRELSAQNAALTHSLAENERMHLHLQQVVDSMPCGVLVLDEDGSISMMNPESIRLLDLGFSADVLALKGIDLQSSPNSQELCFQGSTGKRWLELRTRTLKQAEENGREQTILIVRDITTQRRDQQEREAGRRAMALSEITTILAHEMRNPLASLELFAELIEDDTDNRAQWISHLRAGIRSLSATTNNVLSFHGSRCLHLTPLLLSALIEKAIAFVRPLAEQAAVSVIWQTTQDPSMVTGNDTALQQVVLNLVSNAIRHTPAGGRVTVSLRSVATDRGGEEAVIEFADTGCGIREDQALSIFEPGFSGSGDTSGLGLAVCRQIMKQHNGSICLAPGSHLGAKFELHLPILTGEKATA